jgi:hypothetical protein
MPCSASTSCRHGVAVLRLALDALLRLDVVLVLDVTDDQLQHVLDGHHAGDTAVLVDDDGQVVAAGTELLEQGIEALALGDEDRRAQHVTDAEAGDAGTEGEQVLGQQDADHLVAAVADHREARVTRLERGPDQLQRRILAADHDHLRARDHDVVDPHLGHLQHPVDHLQCVGVEDFALAGVAQTVEQGFEVGRLAAQRQAQAAEQGALCRTVAGLVVTHRKRQSS